MDIESQSTISAIDIESQSTISGFTWIKSLVMKMIDKGRIFEEKVEKLGTEGPRRLTHSLKVGFTLALISILFYFSPIYGGFGAATMCAILTVAIVFEFSVGATLGRGLNRAISTFLAGALGLGAHYLADLAGNQGEPILLGLFVFLLATIASFSRFYPGIKSRYDFGVLTFILTFSLVSISGYRNDEILKMVLDRFSTVLPVWAGEDLQKLICGNMDKLADFLQDAMDDTGKSFLHLHGCESILDSKKNEESFVNFARWEPPHGSFRYAHPWKH